MEKSLFEHNLKTQSPINNETDQKTTPQTRVKFSTDGACIGNPGPGGWACLLRFDRHEHEMFGTHPRTTNNRMELQAVIEGLKWLSLRGPHTVLVSTDSQYVYLGATAWLPVWKARCWKKSSRSSSGGSLPVLNQDLWFELDWLTAKHTMVWQW